MLFFGSSSCPTSQCCISSSFGESTILKLKRFPEDLSEKYHSDRSEESSHFLNKARLRLFHWSILGHLIQIPLLFPHLYMTALNLTCSCSWVTGPWCGCPYPPSFSLNKLVLFTSEVHIVWLIKLNLGIDNGSLLKRQVFMALFSFVHHFPWCRFFTSFNYRFSLFLQTI